MSAFTHQVKQIIDDHWRRLMRHRERYVKAWIAETGLRPSECEIVEELRTTEFGFQTILRVRHSIPSASDSGPGGRAPGGLPGAVPHSHPAPAGEGGGESHMKQVKCGLCKQPLATIFGSRCICGITGRECGWPQVTSTATTLSNRGDRPTVPEAVNLILAVYAQPMGGAGCCLHVVTDDGNYRSSKFCADYAKERGHALCERAAVMLSKMTVSQVRRAVRQADAFWRLCRDVDIRTHGSSV